MKILKSIYNLAALAPIGVACILAGCTPIPTLMPIEGPAPVAPAPVDPTPPPPIAEAAPKVPPPAPPATTVPLRTAVLLSDDIPEFMAIADEIKQRSDNEHLVVYNLNGNLANSSRIKTEAAGVDQVIAIGLLAATLGREIESKRMVFCQVFNYQEHDLLSANSKGVNLLPPFDIQLQRWTAFAPELSSIGILTGPNQDDLVAEIRAATERQGVGLVVNEVSSDKEALYAFKRITPEIQGLWLLPDNRILSPAVVREIMSYSARHRKQVLVFGSNLLGIGGLISVTSDPGDVAEQVLARLDQVSPSGELTGPAMRPLTTLHIEINPEVARHLGLDTSQHMPEIARNDE